MATHHLTKDGNRLLEGDIEEFGADALIRLIAGSRRSGHLELRRASGRGELRFSVGDVCGAYSSFADEPLGFRLVGAGVITRRRVRAALDEHVGLGYQLGKVLIESGDIDRELLFEALREQMLDRILDILDWETGTFRWTPSEEVRLDEAIAITAREVFEERDGRNTTGKMVKREMPRDARPEDRHSSERRSGHPPAHQRTPNLSFAPKGSSEDIFDVVIVCTGNQFRSPIVEGLMRASTTRLALRVTSVGTKELGAAPALPEAIRLASEFGVDLTAHRARSLRGFDLSEADLVIGFELEHIAAAVVEANARYERTFTILELISLLKDVPVPDREDPVGRARAAIESAHQRRSPERPPLSPDEQIRDPLGGQPSAYRETADHLRTATRQLIDRLFGFVPYSPPPPD
jgi:protein-tyrosine phosphatase